MHSRLVAAPPRERRYRYVVAIPLSHLMALDGLIGSLPHPHSGFLPVGTIGGGSNKQDRYQGEELLHIFTPNAADKPTN